MNFRIGQLRVELSFPLVAIMTAIIIFDTTMSVVICFIALIAHELGHLAMLGLFDSFPKKIKLTLFDIEIVDNKKYKRSSKKELMIVLAGVTVNFLLSVIFYMIYTLSDITFFKSLYMSNFALGIFNILPIDSLDGGQALYIFLSERLSIYTSMLILDIISFIALVPIAIIGFMVLFESKYNFTLLITALYLIALILLKHKNIILH